MALETARTNPGVAVVTVSLGLGGIVMQRSRNRGLTSRMACRLGRLASLTLVAALMLVLVAGVPPTAAASGTYTEDFTTTTYLDGAATNATGWGTGALRLPHKALTLLDSYDTPDRACGVAVAGGLAYVADGNSGILLFNVTNPRSLTLLAAYNTPDFAQEVAVAGGLAYLADQASGLQILNVTNPRSPTLLGSYDTPNIASGVVVAGGLAYVTDRLSGLLVVNVTNPRSPTLLGAYNTPGLAWGVAVAGAIAYVADYTSGLQVVNVTNPRSPTLLGNYNTPDLAVGVWVDGCIAYVSDASSGLHVLNVTNPRQLAPLGAYDTPNSAAALRVAGGIAYIADGLSGLQVVNVTNPHSPTLLGAYDTPDRAWGVAVAGSVAYVADAYSGLHAVSIADFATPVLVGTYGTPDRAQDVTVAGGLAYIADYSAGLQVLNVTDPRNPTFLGSYDTPGVALGVAVTGQIAYVADGELGLQILNVTNPRSPTLLGSYDTLYMAREVAVADGIAYIGDDSGSWGVVYALNVTNPRSPSLLGDYVFPAYSGAYGVAVAGGLAYVASEDAGLQILNVTNPRRITLLGAYDEYGTAYEVAVAGNIAYLAYHGFGLYILNVTNPRQPRLLGSYNPTGDACGVVMVGGIAYVASEGGGLQILNVTNPRNPTLLRSCDTPGLALTVAVAGDYAYIADFASGVQVVEVQRNRGRQYEPLAVAQSLTVFTPAGNASVVHATLTCGETLPTGTAMSYALSADGGLHWEAVTPGLEHVFVNVGSELRWRAVLSRTSALQTPTLTSLIITYAAQLNGPTLVSPGDGSVTIDNTPTFEWAAVAGAVSYLVQLDTVVSFDSMNLRTATVGGGTTSYTPAVTLADGTWYWRVAGDDSAGDLGIFSTIQTLEIDAMPPAWDEPLTDQVAEFSERFRYDINASDASGIDYYWVNDTTHFYIDEAGVLQDAMPLSVQVYWVEVRAYNPYARYCTDTLRVTVQDTTPPTWINAPEDYVLESGYLQCHFRAEDPSGIGRWTVNDTVRFTISNTGEFMNIHELAPGRYGLTVAVYDIYDNGRSTKFTITVQGETTTPPIPGFPMSATALGLVVALSTLVAVRRHRRKP